MALYGMIDERKARPLIAYNDMVDRLRDAKHCDGKIGFTVGPYMLFPGSYKYF